MQTFLPHPCFFETARVLDSRRLWNQVNEAVIIYRTLTGYYAKRNGKGWPNHPATKMWSGHLPALRRYIHVLQTECANRGRTHPVRIRGAMLDDEPAWLGDDAFHASHRSNLLRKDPVHYGQFGWTEPDDLEYVWPA